MKTFPKAILAVLTLLLTLAFQALPQSDTSIRLDKDIAVLRHIDPSKLSDAEQEAKAKAIDAAWAEIKASGPTGTQRLKREIEAIDKSNEKDDFFKLNAAALLWEIGKLNEADYIAKIWNSTPLETQYNYVFYTAFDAAKTHDPRALPLIKAVLKNDSGGIYVAAHAMPVNWPLTQEFIWGVYGPDGLPVLNEILNTSSDRVEIVSAMIRLSRSSYLPALPKIRQLASSKDEILRGWAIRCLGIFGHPQDFAFLKAGLNLADPRETWNYVYALYEFDDVSIVPALIPLLSTADDRLRYELIPTLSHLTTPQSWEALKQQFAKPRNDEEKDLLDRITNRIKGELPANYDQLSAIKKEESFAAIRNEKYKLAKSDTVLTRQQFLEAADDWIATSHIYGSKYEWPKERHLLAIATSDDVPLLLKVKAALYTRLSDECLYETEMMDTVIKQLGRRRYRLGSGITAKVEGVK